MNEQNIRQEKANTSLVFSLNRLLSSTKGVSESYIPLYFQAVWYTLLFLCPSFNRGNIRAWNGRTPALDMILQFFYIFQLDNPTLYYQDALSYFIERIVLLSLDIFVYFVLPLESKIKNTTLRIAFVYFLLLKYGYLNMHLLVQLMKPMQCTPTSDREDVLVVLNTQINCAEGLPQLNAILSTIAIVSQIVLAFLIIYSNFDSSISSGGISSR